MNSKAARNCLKLVVGGSRTTKSSDRAFQMSGISKCITLRCQEGHLQLPNLIVWSLLPLTSCFPLALKQIEADIACNVQTGVKQPPVFKSQILMMSPMPPATVRPSGLMATALPQWEFLEKVWSSFPLQVPDFDCLSTLPLRICPLGLGKEITPVCKSQESPKASFPLLKPRANRIVATTTDNLPIRLKAQT